MLRNRSQRTVDSGVGPCRTMAKCRRVESLRCSLCEERSLEPFGWHRVAIVAVERRKGIPYIDRNASIVRESSFDHDPCQNYWSGLTDLRSDRADLTQRAE